MPTHPFSTIVVGAGTAGCILAARLSEDPSQRILLLEAGPDYPPSAPPPPALRASARVPMRGHSPAFDPAHDWNLDVRVAADGSTMAVPQGRLVGGGSAINGSIALRGAPADYDAGWAAHGNPHWDWNHVLPAFRALEDDTAPGAHIHGRGGPVPIARTHPQELSALAAGFVDAAKSVGFPYVHDLNAPDAAGVGPLPQTRVGSRRVSMADAYLAPARVRPNLTITPNALVDRVLFAPGTTRAIGVTLADGTIHHAPRIVLTAGAVLTPAILQRSGVGPAAHLRSLGIPLVADLPVGDNLGDHFAVPLLAVPVPSACADDDFALQAGLRTSSGVEPHADMDLQLTFFSYLHPGTSSSPSSSSSFSSSSPSPNTPSTTPRPSRSLAGTAPLPPGTTRLAGLACVLNKPLSTGTVLITTRHPLTLPLVDPRNLTHPRDPPAARHLLRLAWRILRTPPLATLLPSPLGFTDEIINNDDKLDEAIRGANASAYHFVGTCKMASRGQGGVVDERGRVWGVEGVVVADASVVPSVPAANSMLTVIMLAERIAGALRRSGGLGEGEGEQGEKGEAKARL